jgi:hypothetical protein
MTEIEIEISKDGKTKTKISTVVGEDPACLVYQKWKEKLKKSGIVVEKEVEVERKLGQKVHDHAH